MLAPGLERSAGTTFWTSQPIRRRTVIRRWTWGWNKEMDLELELDIAFLRATKPPPNPKEEEEGIIAALVSTVALGLQMTQKKVEKECERREGGVKTYDDALPKGACWMREDSCPFTWGRGQLGGASALAGAGRDVSSGSSEGSCSSWRRRHD